jgi:hypothetical protein
MPNKIIQDDKACLYFWKIEIGGNEIWSKHANKINESTLFSKS